MSHGDWILNDSPRGEQMPIDCTYGFSFGKPGPDLRDLPDGWRIAGIGPMADEVQHFPTMGPDAIQGGLFAFLLDPHNQIVATWDEGRWWTPDESRAWLTMLQVPATYVMAEGMRQAQMPRWWRRRQNRKRRK